MIEPEAPLPLTYPQRILLALNVTGKHIYAGSVPAHVKAKRRAKNRVAKQSRRTKRKGN